MIPFVGLSARKLPWGFRTCWDFSLQDALVGLRMTGDCEYCFACIQNCPQKAIRFAPSAFPNGKEVNPNARYRNEYV